MLLVNQIRENYAQVLAGLQKRNALGGTSVQQVMAALAAVKTWFETV